MDFNVKFTWYEDERVWLATSSSDKFAMTLDHGSFDALLERVTMALHDIATHELKYCGVINLKLDIDRTVQMDIEDSA